MLLLSSVVHNELYSYQMYINVPNNNPQWALFSCSGQMWKLQLVQWGSNEDGVVSRLIIKFSILGVLSDIRTYSICMLLHLFAVIVSDHLISTAAGHHLYQRMLWLLCTHFISENYPKHVTCSQRAILCCKLPFHHSYHERYQLLGMEEWKRYHFLYSYYQHG